MCETQVLSDSAPLETVSMAPLSPAALHRHLLRLQAERNQTHWRFLEALLLVDEGRYLSPRP